jgi:DNA polymerase-4
MDDGAKRIIFLVDMNAFFISCEMSRRPELKDRPAAVAGDPKNRMGIILAANYNARAYGVKTTMLVHEAKSICPGLILVKPDHDFYEKKSKKVMELLSNYTPVLQQNSIDEAWLDLTGCEALFGKPLQIAERIMEQIRSELDLWCSIGISDNKFLSKMAADMKKPLGITELWQKDVRTKLWPLKVGEMYGIGKKTEKRLIELGILTIGDIAKCDKSILRSSFGKYGEEMRLLANGIDPSPVMPHPKHETRSISRSTTLSKDIDNIEIAKKVILDLAEEVGSEARRNDFKGRTVSIAIRYNDFTTITRQKTISPSYLTKDIYNTGISLLRENWRAGRPVRLLGIGLGNIDEDSPEQLSIFDINNELKDEGKREEKLERTIDSIRMRFGKDKLIRAKLLE